MVTRAVDAVLACGMKVVVLDEQARRHAVSRACAGQPVRLLFPHRPHAGQRAVGTWGDGLVVGDVVVLHDAARPFAPPALFDAVVGAVRAGHAAAVPVLPLTDTVKLLDAVGSVLGTPDRSGLRVVQSPYAIRAELLQGVPVGALTPSVVLDAALVVHTVAGDPAAFAVLSAYDLERAELMAGRVPT